MKITVEFSHPVNNIEVFLTSFKFECIKKNMKHLNITNSFGL